MYRPVDQLPMRSLFLCLKQEDKQEFHNHQIAVGILFLQAKERKKKSLLRTMNAATAYVGFFTAK
jgi:hypothetical protein